MEKGNEFTDKMNEKMEIKIFKDYQALSEQAASEIEEVIKLKPDAVICLATGESPKLTYQLLVKKLIDGKIDLSDCTLIGLDEWVGVPPTTEGSCHHFLYKEIFSPLGISENQIHLFDALSGNLFLECQNMDKLILEKGDIDLMVVGIGMNGHIGFNEPGIPVDNYSHVINLDSTTQTVGQKYFAHPTELKKGITLGLKHLLQAEKVVLLANGDKKASIIKETLEGPISIDVPATVLRMHLNAMVIIDEEAAGLLSEKTLLDSQTASNV
ncbi:MAG: glucosamine-6-phosphate deaminase [Bacteroidetes bacterium]|nr:MAG: glucosamine-6-phosphate deaminase [Bacteroidota bacterium]